MKKALKGCIIHHVEFIEMKFFKIDYAKQSQEDYDMKRIIAMLLAVMMVFALCACDGTIRDKINDNTDEKTVDGSKGLSMGTGGPAGTYYAFGGILCQVVGGDLDISMTAVTTGGSGANLESMGAVYQLATVQSDVMTYAFEGTNSFAESGKLDNFRVLCAVRRDRSDRDHRPQHQERCRPQGQVRLRR